MKPRPYQTKATEDARAAFAAGRGYQMSSVPINNGEPVYGLSVLYAALAKGKCSDKATIFAAPAGGVQ